MLVEQAVVKKIADGWIEVEAIQRSACDACSQKGCGNGVVAKAFGSRLHRLSLPDPGNLKLEQEVKIALPEQTLLSGASLIYLLPLIAAIVFAVAVSSLQPMLGAQPDEGWQIAAALSGGIIGWFFARRKARQLEQDPACRIQILQDEQLPVAISHTMQDSGR
ncbi:SoxR reducing system RseC family protein [Corallincola platygyrae]|uniref:SoxR reducing system RseC family protein n=1 Tax=Corallincola platygyrae TaxID=1193278 RepID=A0ABW4XPG7_9GAMM